MPDPADLVVARVVARHKVNAPVRALRDIASLGRRLVELLRTEAVVSLPRITADVTAIVDRAENSLEGIETGASDKTPTNGSRLPLRPTRAINTSRAPERAVATCTDIEVAIQGLVKMDRKLSRQNKI